MFKIVQFVKKFLARRLINVFTWDRHPPYADETSIHPYQAFLHDRRLHYSVAGVKFPPTPTTSSSKIPYAAITNNSNTCYMIFPFHLPSFYNPDRVR